MTELSVNINKFATLRNARGQNQPNLIEVCKKLIGFGVKGITVHPRPDERHIKREDVFEIAQLLKSHQGIEFNIEGYPSRDFLDLVAEIRPAQVTLVPDPPDVLTSNAGWELEKNCSQLKSICNEIQSQEMRASLFVDVFTHTPKELEALQEIQPQRVELYTESYAKYFATEKQNETLKSYSSAAKDYLNLGIELNAGHDLNQQNLSTLITAIPELKEVSIGHALVCEAIDQGLETTIKNYQKILG